MSAPTVPTANNLVTEGLRQAGIFNPTASQVSTYLNEVMEQLKNNLWTELKQAKPLMTFSYAILVPGQSRYSCPSDFSSDMSMALLTGLATGTAQSGTAPTLTMPSSAGKYGVDNTLGKDLVITGGSAVASVSQIVGVVTNGDGSTTLTVYPDFQAIPDGTSTYMIVDNQYPIEADHIANYDRFRTASLDRPRKFFPMGDEDYDEFILDCPPDANYTYAIRMRYTVNIMTLDLNSTLMSTLYQKFREYWIKGIKAQALMDNDDTRGPTALQERNSKLQELILSQQYGTDIRTLRQNVQDYM